METLAIVIDNPGQLDLRKVALREPAPGDVIVETREKPVGPPGKSISSPSFLKHTIKKLFPFIYVNIR